MTSDEARELTCKVAEVLGFRELKWNPPLVVSAHELVDKSGGWWSGLDTSGLLRVARDYATDWSALPEMIEWIMRNTNLGDSIRAELYRPPVCYRVEIDAQYCGEGPDLPEAIARAVLALHERLKT